MKVKPHIAVACVKRVGEGDEISGDYYSIFHEIIRVKFMGEPIKNVYFLIVSGSTQMFFKAYIILNLSLILRLIIIDVTESLTYLYLLILQLK